MKKILLMLAAGLMVLASTGCKTFSVETREYSAVVTDLAGEIAVMNNIVLGWHRDVLVSYRDASKLARQQQIFEETGELVPLESITILLQMTNPEYDPAKPGSEPYIYVDINKVVKDIEDLMKLNLQLSESLDTLDESIQADQGLDPLFKEVKAILADEQVIALVKLYKDKLKGN